MAERDPFGRLPDENPLAGLGALSDGTTSQAAEPVVVAADGDWSGSEPGVTQARPAERERPAAQDQPAMSASSAKQQQRQRPSNPVVDESLAEVIRQAEALGAGNVVHSVRTIGRVVRVVVFLAVLGVIFGVAKPIFDAGKDVRDTFNDLPSPGKVADDLSPPSSDGKDAEESVPTGLSSNSMFVRRNFDRAMDRLSKAGLGRVRTLSVRPERIDAQLLTKGGSLRSVQIRSGSDAEINDFGAGSPGFSHLETILYSKINRAAPARLARGAAGRVKRPVSQVDYVVLLSFAGNPMWSVFTKSGTHFQANSQGRITRRLN